MITNCGTGDLRFLTPSRDGIASFLPREGQGSGEPSGLQKRSQLSYFEQEFAQFLFNLFGPVDSYDGVVYLTGASMSLISLAANQRRELKKHSGSATFSGLLRQQAILS